MLATTPSTSNRSPRPKQSLLPSSHPTTLNRSTMKEADVVEPAAPASGWLRRSHLLTVVAAAALFVLGAGIALSIALPLTIKDKDSSSNGTGVYQLLGGPGSAGDAAVRRYFLAAEPVSWDYAPSGRDVCKGKELSGEEALHVTQGLGRVFAKALFKQYSDSTFMSPINRSEADAHLGLLGPMMHAEVGDVIEVVLQNQLPFAVNLEPAGMDFVNPPAANPGDTVTYRWVVPAAAAPQDGDSASTKMWMYRSTVDVVGHTQAGLAGPLIIGRPGSLNGQGRPNDVDHEFVVVMQVFNEANSPLYDTNVAGKAAKLNALSPADQEASLLKHTINGYLLCNGPIMDSNVGDRVRWYMSGLGSEEGIHTAHWHGITLNHQGHHLDQIVIQSSEMVTLDSVMDNPGVWLFHCHVNEHMSGGMMTLFTVNGEAPALALDGAVHEYFVGVVADEWDYAPLGGDMCSGVLKNFTEAQQVFTASGPDRFGSKLLKARYVEFEDGTFTTRKARTEAWQHLGVLGPVLRATVGDTLIVHMRNMLTANHTISMHPHGVLYNKSGEGAPYADGTSGADKLDDLVAPGQTYTYTWHVPDRAGPGPADPSSVVWLYHSHVLEAADPYAGLYGGIIITRADAANADSTPNDVAREFMLAFQIMDEQQSIMFAENMKRYLNLTVATDGEQSKAVAALLADEGFAESNVKHNINGYLYCNLPGFNLKQGETARVYYLGMGGQLDMHTPNSAEIPMTLDGARMQSVRVLPGNMRTADVTPMVAGQGILQCHVDDHILAGMSALYEVEATQQPVATTPTGTTRQYYIAAEQVDWDYAPLGTDGCNGQPFTVGQKTYVETTATTLGSKYRKAVYREYTDTTFTTTKDSPPTFGLLGPMLRAEVGDTLQVTFLNKLPFPANLSPFGGLVPVNASATAAKPVSALRAAAGARKLLQPAQVPVSTNPADAPLLSADALSSEAAVAPRQSVVYAWSVPATAGPTGANGDVVAYSYVSSIDRVGHTIAGLVGPLLVYKQGAMPAPGTVLELPLLFNVFDETLSPYLEFNVAAQEKAANVTIDRTADSFAESNKMHSINGHMFCNGPAINIPSGSKVRWVMMGFGTETGMHSPVFSGQDIMFEGQGAYSVGLMPSRSVVVDMHASTPGAWPVYCNVLDHVAAGMLARMVVA